MAVNPVLERAGRLSPEAAGARLHDLFAEHSRMVYGVCRLLLRDSHEAEDAAQQAFLSAHKSLLGGTHPREPRAWLAAIARNECAARARERMREPLPFDAELEPASDSTEQVVVRREEIAALRGAMLVLPDQQRDAVVLREFYGLRYDEVGAALGVSRPAVESLLFRARRRLQAELGPLRLASGGLAVPAALREAIAQAVPGFAAAGTGAGGIGLAALFSKAAVVPLAAKVAAAALAVTAAGTSVGIVGSSDHADRRARVAAARAIPESPVLGQTARAGELALVGGDASSPPGQSDEARLGRSSKAQADADEASAEESEPELSAGEDDPAELPVPTVLPATPAGEDVEDDEQGDSSGPGPGGDDEHSRGDDSSSSGEGPDRGEEEFAFTSSGDGSSDHEESPSEESETSGAGEEPETGDESPSSGESSDSPDGESVSGSSG